MIKLEAQDTLLKSKITLVNKEQFVQKFFNNSHRKCFENEFLEFVKYAVATNARYFFIGGSFITNSLEPSDIDCLIVYGTSSEVPDKSSEELSYFKLIDSNFASLDFQPTIEAYLHLYSHNRNNVNTGLVQLVLNSHDDIWTMKKYSVEEYELVKKIYAMF